MYVKVTQETTLTVYHGSYTLVESPRIITGTISYKDFGHGFYCTEFYPQAERWAQRKTRQIRKKIKTAVSPIVNEYVAQIPAGLYAAEFQGIEDEWLDFIADCRSGRTHKYDIVEGPMADDTINTTVYDYLNKRITREQFMHLCQFKYPTHQIAFCTPEAVSCLRLVRYYNV